jgi:hypothetical protein
MRVIISPPGRLSGTVVQPLYGPGILIPQKTRRRSLSLRQGGEKARLPLPCPRNPARKMSG